MEDLLAVYPYHRVPDEQSPEDIALAHLECFSTNAGVTVLNRMYWAYVMTSPPLGEAGQRHQGKCDMFREIIDMMHRGESVRRNA